MGLRPWLLKDAAPRLIDERHMMLQDVQEILIDRHTIQARIAHMAQDIGRFYNDHELVLMPLLTGAIIFVADLVRHLPVRMKIDVLAVSSYRGKATVNEGTRVLYPTTFDVVGKHVLVIDDILDSGQTLAAVTKLIQQQNAASVKSCVLLKKKLPTKPLLDANWVGFEIPNEFVVGYGLDFNGYYRNLPDIAVLHKHAMK